MTFYYYCFLVAVPLRLSRGELASTAKEFLLMLMVFCGEAQTAQKLPAACSGGHCIKN